MKKMLRKSMAMILSLILSIMMVGTVYAQSRETAELADAREMTTVRTKVTSNEVETLGVTRGQVLSSAEMELTDKGGGEVDIYVEVLCHETVSKLRMKVYLEKWVESSSTWSVVDTKDYTWTLEDDENLSMAIVNYNVLGVSPGKYRLRGSFSARGIESGLSEAWAHSTPVMQIGNSTTP